MASTTFSAGDKMATLPPSSSSAQIKSTYGNGALNFGDPALEGVARQYYPKVDNLPPEVSDMLQEKRKRVYALKMLLKAEEDSLRVYERMLGE